MNKPKTPLLVGGMLLFSALSLSIRTAHFSRRAVRTIGEVVAYTEKGNNSPGVIERGLRATFTAAGGR